LTVDADCAHNLAGESVHAERVTTLRERMETRLKAQGDPRMAGNGDIFDRYTPTNGDGFYEKFMSGEKLKAGWVSETDFEPTPLLP
jgi:N-sulfoglucosamine sulfohydrolase